MRKLLPVLLLATLLAPAAFAEKKWIPADRQVACAEARDKDLCARLLTILDRDQVARYAALNDPDNAEREKEVDRVDAENIVQLEEIIARVGWPGKTLVGGKASGAVWTVLQHSDHAILKKHLGLMTKAAEAGEVDGDLLATSIDRVRVGDGQPQVYGTQFHQVNGEWVPRPIEDEANVDARRKSVGLGPLAEYTALLRQMHSQQPKKQ
ncbi:MAG TPA: DUF6624 domain-containing protein [Thermoanaerobaculia bacterium]|nr:DUF6624 domain-containing protein [Thermoanaerobaculia bacterium]